MGKRKDYKKGDLVWYDTVAYEIIAAEWAFDDGPRYTLRGVANPAMRIVASPVCVGWDCRTKAEVASRPRMSDFIK